MFEHDSAIPTVLERIGCGNHNAERGKPCWQIWTLTGPKLPAVCNRRAKNAGFNGEINERSLRRS